MKCRLVSVCDYFAKVTSHCCLPWKSVNPSTDFQMRPTAGHRQIGTPTRICGKVAGRSRWHRRLSASATPFASVGKWPTANFQPNLACLQDSSLLMAIMPSLPERDNASCREDVLSPTTAIGSSRRANVHRHKSNVKYSQNDCQSGTPTCDLTRASPTILDTSVFDF